MEIHGALFMARFISSLQSLFLDMRLDGPVTDMYSPSTIAVAVLTAQQELQFRLPKGKEFITYPAPSRLQGLVLSDSMFWDMKEDDQDRSFVTIIPQMLHKHNKLARCIRCRERFLFHQPLVFNSVSKAITNCSNFSAKERILFDNKLI